MSSPNYDTTPLPVNTQVKETIAKTTAKAIITRCPKAISAHALKAVEHLPCVKQQTSYLLSRDFHQGKVATFLIDPHLPCIDDIHTKYKKSGKNGKLRNDFGDKVKSASTWALNKLDVDALMADLTADTLSPATPSKKPFTQQQAVTPEPKPSRSAAQPVAAAPHTTGKLVKRKVSRGHSRFDLRRDIDNNSSKLSSLEKVAADTLKSTANLREEFGHVYQGLERLGQGLVAVNQRVDHESESRRVLEKKHNVLEKKYEHESESRRVLEKKHDNLTDRVDEVEDDYKDVAVAAAGNFYLMEKMHKACNAEFDALYASQGMERPANSPMRFQLEVPMPDEERQERAELFGENYGSDDDSEFD